MLLSTCVTFGSVCFLQQQVSHKARNRRANAIIGGHQRDKTRICSIDNESETRRMFAWPFSASLWTLSQFKKSIPHSVSVKQRLGLSLKWLHLENPESHFQLWVACDHVCSLDLTVLRLQVYCCVCSGLWWISLNWPFSFFFYSQHFQFTQHMTEPVSPLLSLSASGTLSLHLLFVYLWPWKHW